MKDLTLNDFLNPTSEITDVKKATQRNTIMQMLRIQPRHCGEFLKVGIAQYNARILELREQGNLIHYDRLTKKFILIEWDTHALDAKEKEARWEV